MYESIPVDIYRGSVVEYARVEPQDSTIILQVSYNAGRTWHDVEPGEELPELTYGQSMESVYIDFRTEFDINHYVEDEGDMPSIQNLNIYFVTEDEGTIHWMGEDGEGLDNNIEVGENLSQMQADNTRSHNLEIEGSKGWPLRIRTKFMNFGEPKMQHQLRKIFTEFEASGGYVTLRVYSEGELISEKEVDLQESKDPLNPQYIRSEVIKTCDIESLGDRVAVEIMADEQTYFMIRDIEFETFHRRKI